MAAIYKGHPMFAGKDFEFWYPPMGDDGRLHTVDFGLASMEGGDVMPIGNGTVATNTPLGVPKITLVDGFKLGSHDPDVMSALLDEAKKLGLKLLLVCALALLMSIPGTYAGARGATRA